MWRGSDLRCSDTVDSASASSVLIRALGRGGSTSRSMRLSSSKFVFFSISLSKGVVPASSS